MRGIQAVIFDLDGVIVSTDEYHYRAWKRLADAEGIAFDKRINDRLRGVSRMESLDIILEKSARCYTQADKRDMADRKNNYYRGLLTGLGAADILPGVVRVFGGLRRRGVKLAVGSSSKNAVAILRAVGLEGAFDVVADGTHIARSKPDPEVFLLASERLSVAPESCLVVEDADAGVDAGLAAGMPVLAVGTARWHTGATIKADDLSRVTVDEMLAAGTLEHGKH